MSKIIYVLSQIPDLAKLTTKALPDCQVINISLRQYTGVFSLGLRIGEPELNDLKDAEILFGDPNLLAQTFHKLPKIKWIQSTWAGIDWFIDILSQTGQNPPECPITRFSGESFGQSMFDYCIGHMIMTERKFFDDYINTKVNKIWKKEVLWDYKSTNEMTVAILGATGAIGSYMAQKFRLLGSKVLGYGRSERFGDSIRDISLDKYSNKLEEILPECDYLISVLPSTTESKGLLNNGVLELCKEKSPVFINIGRGSVIAENQIIDALNNKWISLAILDVFETEPLPQSSPLWAHPNVLITPHNAAVSRAKDCVKLFVENYGKFVAKQQMLYLIDWKSGY